LATSQLLWGVLMISTGARKRNFQKKRVLGKNF